MQKNNLVFKTIYFLFGRKSFEIMSKSHLKKKGNDCFAKYLYIQLTNLPLHSFKFPLP